MADSTLDPDYLAGGRDRSLGRGHGNDALGPSDSSDTGSDTQGPGDGGIETDTDSNGTGERAGVDRESIEGDGADIDVDRVDNVEAVDPDDTGTDVDAGR